MVDPTAEIREHLAHGSTEPPKVFVRRRLAEFYGIPMTRARWIGELTQREIETAWLWFEVESDIATDAAKDRRPGGNDGAH